MRNLIAGLLYLLPAGAQTITSSIVGSVADPTELPVVGVEVVLRQPSTGLERRTQTDARGDFIFGGLQRGEYDISVTHPGFKKLERRGLVLSTSETLSAGTMRLEVGTVADTVTVAAQGAMVQTASAERAGVVTSSQVDGLAIRGRNPLSLLQLVPGVLDNTSDEAINRNFNINALGNRNNTNNVMVDGMTMNAIGTNVRSTVNPSQDAVSEVKVLLSNYQAEFGRMSGANIQIITKSGTQHFHGLGSYFKRHEQFNANNFFANRLGQPKPPYRYHTWNGSVGGPVYIPGKFNRNREKLFFYFSIEHWPLRTSNPITQLTVPSELERAGNFSQTLDLNNRLIVVNDPSNNRAPFPGNIIPSSRIDPSGQSLMKVSPGPNFFDRGISAGRYNYVFQSESSNPQRTQTLKFDYHFTPRDILTFNWTYYFDNNTSPAPGANWPMMIRTADRKGKLGVIHYQKVISPTLVNELNAGLTSGPEIDFISEEELTRVRRDIVGFRAGQFNPGANPLSIIPSATFGGVQSPATLGIESRTPHRALNETFNLTDTVSKTVGAHTLKGGIYIDQLWRNASNGSAFNGQFDFGRNVNNPLDTNYAYSNAALGVFNTYTEASAKPYSHYRVSNLEWFVQDNWKVTRRLTLDYGMRFYRVFPLVERDNLVSGFDPARYDPARRVALIAPALRGTTRVGLHPVTGEVYPAALIGAIAPNLGDPFNGMVVPARDSSYPRALHEDRGTHYAPRFGFAFDPTGKGKTAIRSGFGMFYNRQNLGATLNEFTVQQPLVLNPIVYYSTISSLLSSSGFQFPANILALDRIGKVPTVMNFSFSIQHNLGFGTIADVAYVGVLSRHLMWQRNLNAIPFGANFSPANADPTVARTPLPANFLRPIPGYGNINLREWATTSNYNSLQVSVIRRYARRLQYGLAWTWSKTLDYTDSDTQNASTLVPVRVWNYGLANFDRTHIVKVNWLYDVPNSPWGNAMAKAALNEWQISGIASFVSGAPLGVGFSTVTATDITGSPTDGARIVVTGNPVLPKSERTFSRNFRTGVFQAPSVGTYGNSAKTLIRGPGINNWDLAIFKNFPIREQVRLQFRWELYNAFNHTQFSAVDTAARFDAQGSQVNTRLGEFTAARGPRIMQFALRMYF